MPTYWNGFPLLEGLIIWKLTAAPEPGMNPDLHIWEFPGSLDDYWLTDICAQENGIVTISIHTDDQAEIRKTE